jgi:hypothetical protein
MTILYDDQIVERAFVQSVRQGFGPVNAWLEEFDNDSDPRIVELHQKVEADKEKLLETFAEAVERVPDRRLIKELLRRLINRT